MYFILLKRKDIDFLDEISYQNTQKVKKLFEYKR